MSSAAITVLQERCGNLQASLASKEEIEKTLRAKLVSLEESHSAELNGLRVELDSANASLRKEQSEKKLIKLEKSELEVTVSSLAASAEAKVADAVAKVRAELLDTQRTLEAELAAAQMAVQSATGTGMGTGQVILSSCYLHCILQVPYLI